MGENGEEYPSPRPSPRGEGVSRLSLSNETQGSPPGECESLPRSCYEGEAGSPAVETKALPQGVRENGREW